MEALPPAAAGISLVFSSIIVLLFVLFAVRGRRKQQRLREAEFRFLRLVTDPDGPHGPRSALREALPDHPAHRDTLAPALSTPFPFPGLARLLVNRSEAVEEWRASLAGEPDPDEYLIRLAAAAGHGGPLQAEPASASPADSSSRLSLPPPGADGRSLPYEPPEALRLLALLAGTAPEGEGASLTLDLAGASREDILHLQARRAEVERPVRRKLFRTLARENGAVAAALGQAGLAGTQELRAERIRLHPSGRTLPPISAGTACELASAFLYLFDARPWSTTSVSRQLTLQSENGPPVPVRLDYAPGRSLTLTI